MKNESAIDFLKSIGPRLRQKETVGICAVCSAHPMVLAAAMEQAAADNTLLLVESTCNQVNQYGGYSGMTPDGFVRYVYDIAGKCNFPTSRILVGGDHLGPHVWKNEPAEAAMQKAVELVRACAAAGYEKIHLDAGMACADDPGPSLSMAVSAQRTARLCSAAESAWRENPESAGPPLYVIGAEAPTPGGSLEDAGTAPVTSPKNVARFLDICRDALGKQGLEAAWERVMAVVVQPGVDFSETAIAIYSPESAAELSAYHDRLPGIMTFEVHATDYQMPETLAQMVRDGFGILKTGPCLTFAFREAVFALADIESEWLGRRKDIRLSRIKAVTGRVMRADPRYLKSAPGSGADDNEWQHAYSYTDRIRYYWPRPVLQRLLAQLLDNLRGQIPLPLISQFLPDQYHAIIRGEFKTDPGAMIRHKIRAALSPYTAACNPAAFAPLSPDTPST